MKIKNARQLKDWIKNISKENKIDNNILLQNFMMERFLERISLSKYRDNFILKGGFLIASMIGINKRSTMDIDTTVKGIQIDTINIEKIMKEIVIIDVGDNVSFEIKNIKNIREETEYDDFRISIEAIFFNIRVKMKIDVTTGDLIIPGEINYSFKMMFEDRKIPIKAYNLDTILAEKIESILARNISNTRARDFYDVYILYKLYIENMDLVKIKEAITEKAKERETSHYVNNYSQYLLEIKTNEYLVNGWNNYRRKYPYANEIEFFEIIEVIDNILRG